jgi:hypothetical protein
VEATEDSVLSDPRWNAFMTQGFACSCGERHVGPFPIHLHHPLGWNGPDAYEDDNALRMDGNFLSSNFCVIEGKLFAMRMRLPVQIRGAEPLVFLYTAWASMDRIDFESFVNAYRTRKAAPDIRVPARLVNRVGGYPDTYNLTGSAFQQPDGTMPPLLIHGLQAGPNNNHPLLIDQRSGIGVDRMLYLFSAYNHDMRNGIPLAN